MQRRIDQAILFGEDAPVTARKEIAMNEWTVVIDGVVATYDNEEDARAAFAAAEPGPPPAPVPFRALRTPSGRTVMAAAPGGASLDDLAALGLPVVPSSPR